MLIVLHAQGSQLPQHLPAITGSKPLAKPTELDLISSQAITNRNWQKPLFQQAGLQLAKPWQH